MSFAQQDRLLLLLLLLLGILRSPCRSRADLMLEAYWASVLDAFARAVVRARRASGSYA